MKSRNNNLSEKEIEKAKNYLLETKKNLKRLNEGKRVRRKYRFLIKDNKLLSSFFGILIISSIVLPVLLLREKPDIIDPIQQTVDDVIELIEANYTNNEGFPVYDSFETETDSDLIILSSFTSSILSLTDYEKINSINKTEQILTILSNNLFVEYDNITIALSPEKQFFGLYALLQAYLSLRQTEKNIQFNEILEVTDKVLDLYFSPNRSLIVRTETNTSYFIDQALAILFLSTLKLVSEYEYLGNYFLGRIIEDLLNAVSENFFNSTNNIFYQEIDLVTNATTGFCKAEELIFFALALSRTEKFYYGYSFPMSSYGIHQKIINEKTDSNWLVHSNSFGDTEILIKNQAFFTLASYLMNLYSVGNTLKNSTETYFSTEEGFINRLDDEKITCESCLYGLITLTCYEWSLIQNQEEAQPEPYASGLTWFITLITILWLIPIYIKIKKKSKNGDQAEI